MDYQPLLTSVQFIEYTLLGSRNALDMGDEGASDVPPALRECRCSRKEGLQGSAVLQQWEAQKGQKVKELPGSAWS